ncbi:UDP-glucose/GDP-mannose dehydrogenase family protein [Paenibacillus sp. N4]|uniref:UDP-glucose dehydrogenase family protein n=1 Tax=Paenibacillus vietnamensis TaxID=2590547 RepID=UPI001CD1173C|nr:UDP-glucose/GDP-mannose dehydrogenase family protein [Paenibacillus vietnamensis]MCA0755682.1 UDP-glucose/GDP-mannose dehydrogenase family protein [Paenibacillus vietnamensis]
MNIAVIGTGYVGLVSGVCYAELGNRVYCVDKDPNKINTLQLGGIPIYEPGLQSLSVNNMKQGRLIFTTDLREAVQQADVVIIAVGTPPLPSGEADMSYIKAAAREIGESMNGYKVICVKSTVPVGTNMRVRKIVSEVYPHSFDIASLPEFLREGTAVQDTMNPDRIVIGTDSTRAANVLTKLHQPLTKQIKVTDIRSAEMIKYASNAFLAAKISFINEIANICEKVGADVKEVAEGMGLDPRIGPSFLRAGIGYGGSCFPKDTKALIQIAGNVAYDFKLLKAVVEVNRDQRLSVIEKLKGALGRLEGTTVAVWGLAFKPETDDVREAPALDILRQLILLGVRPKVYDPIAMESFKKMYDDPAIIWAESAMDAVRDSDAVCLLTEWKEFLELDLSDVAEALRRPVFIDGRNVIDIEKVREAGLSYYPIGRPAVIADDRTVSLESII